MAMHWPWQRARGDDRLVIACSVDTFSYAQAGRDGRLCRLGQLRADGDTAADFARRVRALGLPTREAWAVLPLADAQLLPVDAPAVRPEELKSAARWRIKDLVDTRLDELTIDVMFVGDDRARPHKQVFVAAARTGLIRELGERTRAAGLEVSVIDIAETAQRNLQGAQAEALGLGSRATAALVRHGAQLLLTICAAGELFYARRLDWQDREVPAAAAPDLSLAAAAERLDFVDYGEDLSTGGAAGTSATQVVVEVQRSLDVWDRSWPDLPLAALWVQVGEGSAALAAELEAGLGQPVSVLDPEHLFPGLAERAAAPDLREALLPLLGALLRNETRKA
jgi:MSHA biogenesis protein MshI